MRGPCGKIKFGRLGVLFALAKAKSPDAPKDRHEKHSYFCKKCKAYHLTSRPPMEFYT